MEILLNNGRYSMTNLLFHSGNYTDLQISGAGNINI
ncbi:MAG: hypothetical protein K1X61_02075 [Chitinophagales bacterium]|nr:hypothetical protein [Chitinophagales bacterium]